MPAITVDNPLVLPRLPRRTEGVAVPRPVARVVSAHQQFEGAGFPIYRPFPGAVSMAEADPFLMLDQAGPLLTGPMEAMGAPWHPHRGFETVSYVMDGELAHHDTSGGGGVIRDGDTQWMTAGSGLQHDELPTERAWRDGGPVHGVQLWVNLPGALKLTPPRYQAITADALRLVTTADGGALVRIVAGEVGDFSGPGVTHSPITLLHATVAPGAELSLPWNPTFNAMAYVLTGQALAGVEGRPVDAHQLVTFGPGDQLTLRAADRQSSGVDALDVLILGGRPIGEPIVAHGPFVMNTRAEIEAAIADYRAGRLGVVPADQIGPRSFA